MPESRSISSREGTVLKDLSFLVDMWRYANTMLWWVKQAQNGDLAKAVGSGSDSGRPSDGSVVSTSPTDGNPAWLLRRLG